jgi:hypothetical protein
LKSRLMRAWRDDKVAQSYRDWYWDTYGHGASSHQHHPRSRQIWLTIGIAAVGLGLICTLTCLMFSQSIR